MYTFVALITDAELCIVCDKMFALSCKLKKDIWKSGQVSGRFQFEKWWSNWLNHKHNEVKSGLGWGRLIGQKLEYIQTSSYHNHDEFKTVFDIVDYSKLSTLTLSFSTPHFTFAPLSDWKFIVDHSRSQLCQCQCNTANFFQNYIQSFSQLSRH